MFESRLSKYKLKKFKRELEFHEVFLDRMLQKREAEVGISEKKFEVPFSKQILKAVLGLILILILILFARTFQLQVTQHQIFSAKAEENKFKIHSIQATRGLIYDRNGKQLAFNRPNFSLVLNKGELPQNEAEKVKVLNTVAKIITVKVKDLETKIKKSKLSQVLISENLDHQTLIVLETKIDELPGFRIKNNWVRKYQKGPDFSHLLGYTGKIGATELKANLDSYSIFDRVGKGGVEKSYEEILRKNPGQLRSEHDALGNLISQKIIQLPQSGKNLILWLDSDLQKKIKKLLQKRMEEVGAKGGAAVALDPNTGGALALVSLPSFDNNLFSQKITSSRWQKLSQDPLKPLNNRAISGQYLVGSTIKPFIALAALEEKIISPYKKINCHGSISIPHSYQPEKVTQKKDWAVHGRTDLRKAIAESCNVYFYTIGGGYKDQKGLGPTKIKKYLEFFGWGRVPKVDLPVPSWSKGLLPDPQWKKKKIGENWWDGDTYNLAIGQGYILVTPLQVASAYSAIANGGKLFQPRVVWKIVDNEKKLIKEIQPQIIRKNFIHPQNLQIVREGMRWAVTGQNSPRASAVLLNSLPFSVAAKTGTAQVWKKDCKDCYQVWVSAFAPYTNPQIVLVLMLEEVKGLQGQIVVPLAKEILGWYFSNRGEKLKY